MRKRGVERLYRLSGDDTGVYLRRIAEQCPAAISHYLAPSEDRTKRDLDESSERQQITEFYERQNFGGERDRITGLPARPHFNPDEDA